MPDQLLRSLTALAASETSHHIHITPANYLQDGRDGIQMSAWHVSAIPVDILRANVIIRRPINGINNNNNNTRQPSSSDVNISILEWTNTYRWAPQDWHVPPTRFWCYLYLRQGPRFLVVHFPSQRRLSGNRYPTILGCANLCKNDVLPVTQYAVRNSLRYYIIERPNRILCTSLTIGEKKLPVNGVHYSTQWFVYANVVQKK